MSKIMGYIASQLGRPRGLIGDICCLCMNISNRRMYNAVADHTLGDHRILDIGFGNGCLISKMRKMSDSVIYGIDRSPDMLRAARKRNRRGVENGSVKLTLGDCCDLRFHDNSLDIVTTANTIYFWSDTMKGLGEIHRVLRPGGFFFNAVYTKEALEKMPYTKEGFRLFSRREYIEMAKEAGFSDVRVHDIEKGMSFMIVCRK